MNIYTALSITSSVIVLCAAIYYIYQLMNSRRKKLIKNNLLDRNYRIACKLGQGMNAATYRVKDIHNPEPILVAKVLLTPDDEPRITTSSFKRHVDRFQDEMENLKLLRNCENIVPVYKYHPHALQPFYVMQYCDKSLDKEIKNGLPSIQTISDVLVDVCNGLSFSHKKKIIHRDLKPANILYYNNKWVLADFGMSLLDNKSSVVTVPESLPGTIPYTAPEVMYYQSITPAADIFSLGVTLKEMLTGFNIWEYEPSTHLQSFNDKRKEYVKYFDELVMEMMKLKPEERPNEIQIIAENLYNIFINLNINANANIYGVDRFKKIYLAADAIKKTASADFIRVNNIHPSQP